VSDTLQPRKSGHKYQAPRLSTRSARARLEARDSPYWIELGRGLRIGYRKGKSAAGVWVLREFRAGKYVRRRLGVADDVSAERTLSWEKACQLAQTAERPTITRPARHTVSAAWEAYRETRTTPVTPQELRTWEVFIAPKLGSREVAELSTHDVEKWLVAQVTAHGKRKQIADGADERDLKRRAQYTANRRFSLLRAVLNASYRKDLVKSADAWRKVRPFQKVDRPRTVTLSVGQAKKLLAKLHSPLRELASGALLTGLRYGELIGLRADDIEASRLRVRHGKGGRERWVQLNEEGEEFFAEQIEGKEPSAPVFERIDPVTVSRSMKAACEAADIKPRATFHDLRRTYGSLQLNSGAAIETIQQQLGHADPRMTRRTYAHLDPKTVAASVQKHLPRFGTKKR
jgi:integrase